MGLGSDIGLLFRIKSQYDNAGTTEAKTDITELSGASEAAGVSFTSMAAAAAIVAVGLAAVAAVAVRTAEGIFNLAESASNFGSRLFDVQQKTGLAAATLSTLDIAAKQSGSSLEQISTSTAKFSKLIGQAAEGNVKAQGTLKLLGVTSTDLDTALQQVFKTISGAQDGVEQMTLAQAAFGKSGADLIPVIKQIDGDLAKATETSKALGLTLTDSDLKAADDFGDTLKQLTEQVKVAASVFALQFAPVLTEGMKEVGQAFAENKDNVRRWGQEFADILNGALIVVDKAIPAIESLGHSASGLSPAFKAAAVGIIGILNPMSNLITLAALATNELRKLGIMAGGGFAKAGAGLGTPGGNSGLGNRAGSTAFPGLARISTGGGGGRGGGGGGAGRTDDSAKKGLEDDLSAAKTTLADLEKTYDATLEKIRKEFADTKDIDKFKEAITALRDSSVGDMQKAVDAVNKLQLKLADPNANKAALAANSKRIDDLNDHLEKSYDKDDELWKKTLQSKYKSWGEYIDKLEKDQDKYDAEEQRSFDERNDSWRKFLQKKIDDQEAYDAESDRQAEEAKQRRLQGIIGSGQEPDAFGLLQNKITDNFTGTKATAMLAGVQAVSTAFQGLGEAVGSAVQAFVLYGSAGATVQQVTAQILAAIAKQAAVQAVYELAQGFAMLALSFFGFTAPAAAPSAAYHFASAAIFAGIAGISALAGRAVAGNSFKQTTANGGTGTSTSSTANRNTAGQGGAYSSQSDLVQETGVNKPGPLGGTITLNIRTNDSHIVDVITKDTNNNGKLRGLILNVANS